MVVGAFPTHLPLLFPLVVILGAKRQSICSLPYDRMQYVATTNPQKYDRSITNWFSFVNDRCFTEFSMMF